MRWCLLAMMACTGCDAVFGLQRRADASIDAVTSDAPDPLVCGTPVLDHAFIDPPPCGAWGGPTEIGASLAIAGSGLEVTLAGTDGAFGGCTHASTTPLSPTGVALHVPAVVDRAGAYVVFHAYPADADPKVGASIVYRGGQLLLFDDDETLPKGSVQYDSARMQWWRLRPDPAGNGVLGEYSADGEEFRLLGIASGAAPSQVKVNFGAGTNTMLVGPTTATFAHLRVCSG